MAMEMKSWVALRNEMLANRDSIFYKLKNYDDDVKVTKDEIIYLLMSAIITYQQKGDDSYMTTVLDASDYWLTNTLVNPGEVFVPVGSKICFETDCEKCESEI